MHIQKHKPQVEPVPPQVCPGCNVYRTDAEFVHIKLRFRHCAVCRARNPRLRKPIETGVKN